MKVLRLVPLRKPGGRSLGLSILSSPLFNIDRRSPEKKKMPTRHRDREGDPAAASARPHAELPWGRSQPRGGPHRPTAPPPGRPAQVRGLRQRFFNRYAAGIFETRNTRLLGQGR